MSCKGSKDCSCGCDKPYGGYERVPLTFGDGGYISKKITNGLDKLIAEQYGGNPKLKEEALAMMKTMAYGGLTEKTSGSVDATADPNAGLSTSAYDAGKTKDGVQFYNKKEGTVLEEVKDAGRFGLKNSLGFTTGVVDTVGNMAGVDINTSDAVRGMKLGERDEGEIERREKAAGISSTVGAAAATVAAAVVTGNPTLVSRGAEQTFTELGEIDPENETLGTISKIGETGAGIYGAVAGGPSAEAVGGGAPIGTTKGIDEVGNAVSYAPGANPDGAGNKFGDIINELVNSQGGQPAGGIPGLAYGGPVSYRPMNNGGYKNDTDPPKAFTPPNNSQSPAALNVNNVISNSLATPGTSFYPNNPVSFNSNTGRLGDQVADIASSMEANKEDVGRPGIGKFGKIKALLDEEGLCRDNTCVEAVKQFYKKVGEEAMPDNVYDNRTFKQNHKEYGFEEVLDQKDIKKGDVIQYYKLRENEKGELSEYPYHMGVNTSPGKYTGDGAESLPVHISDMYTDTQGNKKDSFRVYRKKMPHGGTHTKVGALQEFLANYDDTLTPRQRGKQMANIVSDTQDDLDREEQRVAEVRANIIPTAKAMADNNNTRPHGIRNRQGYNYCNAYTNTCYNRAGATTVEDIVMPRYFNDGTAENPIWRDKVIKAGSKHPQIAGNPNEQIYLDKEGFIPIPNDQLEPGDRIKKELYVDTVPWQRDTVKDGIFNWTPGHSAIFTGTKDSQGYPEVYDSTGGNYFNFTKSRWPYEMNQYVAKTPDAKRSRGYRYVGAVPQYQKELEAREYLLNHLQEQGTFRNPPPPRIDPRSGSIATNVPASDLQGSAYRSLSVPKAPLGERIGMGVKGFFNPNTAKDMGGPIEYKAGGSYQGGLRRWFKEEWKDVKTGKPCGRSKGEDRAYPYCRPSKKVSSKTPATSSHKDAKKRATQKTGPGRVKPIKRKRSKK